MGDLAYNFFSIVLALIIFTVIIIIIAPLISAAIQGILSIVAIPFLLFKDIDKPIDSSNKLKTELGKYDKYKDTVLDTYKEVINEPESTRNETLNILEETTGLNRSAILAMLIAEGIYKQDAD